MVYLHMRCCCLLAKLGMCTKWVNAGQTDIYAHSNQMNVLGFFCVLTLNIVFCPYNIERMRRRAESCSPVSKCHVYLCFLQA